MTFQVQQKRTLDKDRRPSPKDLLDGQLAVNVNQESPGLFFRDGSGELVKAGPVHVGPSQPVLVNHPRFSIGEMWYDTGSQSLKVRTEVGWDTAGTFLADAERLVSSVTNPAGQYLLYYDFSAAKTKLYDLTQLAGALTLENIGGFAAYKTTTEVRLTGFDASILQLGELREALRTTLETRIESNEGLIATLLSDVASNASAITLARSDFETADTLSGTRIAALELTSNSLVDRVTVLEAGGLATSEYVDNRIASLLDGAPAALDTLNELAAALNDDPNTIAALTTQINNVQADVDQNETDSDAADTALSNRLDVLEADPTTATALAAVQADVDQNESDSDAADTALSDRIAVFELDPGPNGATFTEVDTNVDDLITLSGVAENSSDLGTFTGDTITDSSTIKTALQELETALEGHIPVLVEVHNQSGSDIAKGTPVYVSGTHVSGKPTVELADSNGAGTYPAIGLVHTTITDGADGLVNISGFLDGIDTDTPAWDAGTALYLDSTAGALTSTRPTDSAEKVQKVAIVARRHISAGSVIVMGAGRTNDVPNELTALTGVALNATDLGTFTGSTIADSETIKGALQDVETAVETKLTSDAATVRTLLGIGEYADDAAAGTGGVASGAMYYNTTSSDYRLKS